MTGKESPVRCWLCFWRNCMFTCVTEDQILFGSHTFTTFDSWNWKSLCSTASSEWEATITVCGLAASLSLTSPPSCRGTSRSTRRQSAVPPMASNISPRGRSVGGWVSSQKEYFSSCMTFCLLSLFFTFLYVPFVPYIIPQPLNTPAFDIILPGEMCGLKVSN